MQFYLFTADCAGDRTNCLYPHQREITSVEELKDAARLDHVGAKYRNDWRDSNNFEYADVVIMDCDNDFSENPNDWITGEKLEELMPDICFAWVPSRHNQLQKNNFGPRPRGHVYFPVDRIDNAQRMTELKKQIQQAYPFFDPLALDAARFIFGTEPGEIVWNNTWFFLDSEFPEGQKTENGKVANPVNSCVNAVGTAGLVPDTPICNISDRRKYTGGHSGQPENGKPEVKGNEIPEGTRNTTLSRHAARILKRFGEGEESERMFLERADCCNPPLDDSELNSIWRSAVKFYRKKVVSQEGYIQPEDFLDFSEFGYASLKPDDYSDIGESRAFLKEYGKELISTQETQWLRYDGRKWNESDELAKAAVKEFMDLQLREASEGYMASVSELAGLGEDNISLLHKSTYTSRFTGVKLTADVKRQEAEAYLNFVKKRRNMTYVNSTLEAARSDVFGSINDMDQDGFLLNTPGATYDLRLGMVGGRVPDAGDRITKVTMTAPGSQGEKIWSDALNTFFCSDPELINYVQEIVGLAAIGKVYQEALIIAYGDGRNGKSTFWNTIRRIMGEYAGNLPASVLTGTYKENKSALLAELKGARLIIAAELEEGLHLSSSMLKQLCSTDEINACKKFERPFNFIPSHTLVLYTNHLPRVGTMDTGTWRRLIVIPFQATLEGSGDILNYTDYLLTNAAPAIMKWIIEGAQKIISLDYKAEMPKCVMDTIEEYRGSNNWLKAFLDECCDVAPDLSVKAGELYSSFRMFCTRTGEYARHNSDFSKAIENAGFEKRVTNKGKIIYGLSLKTTEDFLQ